MPKASDRERYTRWRDSGDTARTPRRLCPSGRAARSTTAARSTSSGGSRRTWAGRTSGCAVGPLPHHYVPVATPRSARYCRAAWTAGRALGVHAESDRFIAGQRKLMAEDAKYHPAREAAATAIGAAIGGRRCAWRCCGQVAEPGLLTRMSCPAGPRHVLPASGALPPSGPSREADHGPRRLRPADWCGANMGTGGGMTEAQTEPAHDLASLRVVAESPATDPGIREAAQRVLRDAAAAHERAQRVAERIARLRAKTVR